MSVILGIISIVVMVALGVFVFAIGYVMGESQAEEKYYWMLQNSSYEKDAECPTSD